MRMNWNSATVIWKCQQQWSTSRQCITGILIHACWVVSVCPTLCNPMDCSLPGSSVHGILQTIMLEWVAMLSSRGPGDCISYVSCISRCVLYHGATWEAQDTDGVRSFPIIKYPGSLSLVIFGSGTTVCAAVTWHSLHHSVKTVAQETS